MSKIHISRNRQSLGQFAPEEVSAGLASGRFRPDDLAWREGMETWQPLSGFDDLPPAEGPPPVPADAMAPTGEGGGGSLGYGDLAGGDSPLAREPVPAWENRDALGLMNGALQTIYAVLVRPTETFRAMRRSGGLGAPFVFYYTVSVVCGLINLFFNLAWLQILPPEMVPQYGENPSAQSLAGLAFALPVIFFANLVVPFLMAGIYHVLLVILARTQQGFEVTFRVYCYVSGSLAVLGLIPFPPIGIVQGAYFVVIVIAAVVYFTLGLREAHRTTTAAALVCAVAPMVLCCAVLVGTVLAGTAAVAGAVGGALGE